MCIGIWAPTLSVFWNMVFSVCADLRARADWKALADELLAREEPRTPLGLEHRAWVQAQRR